ncbi:MAG: tRNA (N(6)-L-threonylcarbamoyladenosine(37)-C(2))-methylthiotransferase MtaB [Chloroflexi bacterium]|nr:tRNA (N(6)-L-threonylcarbamoyladenosine(37)-C(2))-methylthiotransferase MtaB [Chloroflexota bacterium]
MTNKTSYTFVIETQGCKLNQSDSLNITNTLLESGYLMSDTNKYADIFILNSCTVTHIADRKARNKIRNFKKHNPESTIVATGCYAERSPDFLKSMEEVDLVISNKDKEQITTEISKILNIDQEFIQPFPSNLIKNPKLKTRAMVKIQEGCDQICSYCIVPIVRGREKSIPLKDIVNRINKLSSMGYKEIVLTGTQLGSYGFEFKNIKIINLLKTIISDTDIQRLRISSLQPQDLSSGLLELWENPRLCPHIHIPLQSGNNNLLKQMRRRYTVEIFNQTIYLVRSKIHNVSITTDVIAGFPGEDDKSFQDTYDLCKKIKFSNMHIFPYSKRPKTSAAYFNNDTPSDIKSNRVKALIDLNNNNKRLFEQSFDNSVRKVLWEESYIENNKKYWTGLTDNYLKVKTVENNNIRNKITKVKLNYIDNELQGKIIS